MHGCRTASDQTVLDGFGFVATDCRWFETVLQGRFYAPKSVDKGLFMLAPALTVIPAMIGFLVIPWGGYLEIGGDNSSGHGGEHQHWCYIYSCNCWSLGVIWRCYLVAGLRTISIRSLEAFAQARKLSVTKFQWDLALLCVVLAAGTFTSRNDRCSATRMGSGTFCSNHLLRFCFMSACLQKRIEHPFDLG